MTGSDFFSLHDLTNMAYWLDNARYVWRMSRFFPYRSDTTTTAVSLPEDLGQEGHHGGQARQRGGDGGANVVDGKRMQDAMEKHGFPQQKQRSQNNTKELFLRLF